MPGISFAALQMTLVVANEQIFDAGAVNMQSSTDLHALLSGLYDDAEDPIAVLRVVNAKLNQQLSELRKQLGGGG